MQRVCHTLVTNNSLHNIPGSYIFLSVMTDTAPNPIERARRIAGLTQQQLADAVGMTQPAISLIESDQRTLRLDVAVKIAKVLNVPIESLAKTEAA
jgi:DNA-binding XRE family transcriptional regulator